MQQWFGKTFRAVWVAALVGGGGLSGPASQGQIVIHKTAEEQNPQLCLVSFQGPESVRVQLLDSLRRCNWFRVVGSAPADGYSLSAVYLDGSPAQLELRVSKGNQVVAAFRQPGVGQDDRRLVYAAVDGLIGKLFGRPGPCLSQIAAVQASHGKKEIVLCNFDGSEMRRLTHNGSISTEPSWSADGRQLFYTLYSGSRTSIVQVEVAGGRQRRLVAFPGLNAGAVLSPDGRSLALCLSRDNQVDLYVMQMADQSLRRLTRDVAAESSPTWSPDGSRICYVSDRSGRPQLYVVAAAGGASTALLSDHDEAVSPDWCAVSNSICFSTRQGRQYVIAVVEMGEGGRRKRIVTSAAGDFEAPSWGPDGRHLVCSRATSAGQDLCMVDSWTGRIMPLTQPAGLSLPVWTRSR